MSDLQGEQKVALNSQPGQKRTDRFFGFCTLVFSDITQSS